MRRSMVLAGVAGILVLAGVAGIVLLRADVGRAPAPATAMSPPSGARSGASPYGVWAARRQLQAASEAEHAPVVPPSMQRTRRAISRAPSR